MRSDPMPALVEQNQVGKREDLLNLMTVADAAEKPFMAMVPKGKKPTNMEYSYLVDKFDDLDLAGVADGQDSTNFEDPAEFRKRLYTFCMEKKRDVAVGNQAEDVSDVAAVTSEFSKGLEKKTEELSRDMEGQLCSTLNHARGTSSISPNRLRGLFSWISATAQSGEFPVDSDYLTPSGAIYSGALASFNEITHFKPMLRAQFDQGRKASADYVLLCGSQVKQYFTDNFTNYKGSDTNTWAATRIFSQSPYEEDSMGGKIQSNITVYDGDFGLVKLVPSVFLARDVSATAGQLYGALLDMNMWQARFHTMPKVKVLADGGGGPRATIRTVFSLACLNPKVAGKIVGS